jgi:outer membrane DcaP-like protein
MTTPTPAVRLARWAFSIAAFLTFAVVTPLAAQQVTNPTDQPVDAVQQPAAVPQQPALANPQPVATAGQQQAAGTAEQEPGPQPTAQTGQAAKDPPLPPAPPDKPELEIYGFGQADAIVDFEQNNPDWYDVNRPSKLPAFHHEFGRDGHFYLSPRQSRFGAKAEFPTSNGDVFAQFEFDMFGVGNFAGETTIRLRHAWGQWKRIGAGLTNSQFMDIDVFPNVLDYWGPNGMLFFRNTQVFYELYKDGDSNARVAIENPGASADSGVLTDRFEFNNNNIRGRFPMPDLTGHYRQGTSWGYAQIGAALRLMEHDDLLPNDPFDLNGHNWGYGLSFSGAIRQGKTGTNPTNNLHLQFVWGRGVENYFNDAPVDVGAEPNPGNTVTPVIGEALRDIGIVAYLDHYWSEKFSSTAGYSRVSIDNSELQLPTAFRLGQYATANLVWYPVKNVMMGGEFQWANRRNFSDGFRTSDYRLQFSFKYSFSATIVGG